MEIQVEVTIEEQNNIVFQLKEEYYKSGITLGISTDTINIKLY